MMDDGRTAATEPRWYMPAAIAAVLWELLGCAMYVMQVSADRSTLPLDQRAMWEATPGWMIAAYALAVWIGLAGAIMLALRRKLAEPLLLASFVAVVVQFSGLLVVPALRDRTPADAWLLPLVIVAVAYSLWHFARRARLAGWLR